jgi:glycosyltransferase involved in cell wall biosynthesis
MISPRLRDKHSLAEKNSYWVRKEIVIILAVRNEENYIARCLDSLLDQDLESDKFEIIVIDGMSDDNTRLIVEGYQRSYPNRIRLYENPEKIQAVGRNIGIKNSNSEYVLYIDGHSEPSSSYVGKLLSILKQFPDIAGVGGSHDSPPNEKFFGKATNLAQRSFIGGAGTSYRRKGDQLVDSVAFCMYRRRVLESVGLYDERLTIGEDYELNWRIRRAGLKLMVTQDALIYYYRKHNTLRALFRRMVDYGFWKAKVVKIHPKSIKVVIILPIALIILCISYFPLSILLPELGRLALLLILGYLFSVLATSIAVSIKQNDIKYLIISAILISEHFAIGIGFLLGLSKSKEFKK